VIGVEDGLGIADGAWRVRIGADGEASVERTDGEPEVWMPVGSLSSLLLGGVRATELAIAGLVRGVGDDLAAIDAAF
ncbi:sterol carrier protein domain-containing protein, partial [Staphylococcus aureus]